LILVDVCNVNTSEELSYDTDLPSDFCTIFDILYR